MSVGAEVALDRRRDGLTRLSALRVLGERGAISEALSVSVLLADRDPGLAAATASTISAICARQQPFGDSRSALITRLLEASANHGPWVRARIELGLESLDAFDAARDALAGLRRGNRISCARVLGRLASDSSRRQAILTFSTDPEPDVRFWIAISLGHRDLDEYGRLALGSRVMSETEPHVRVAEAAALGDSNLLREAYDSGDEGVRSIAARALGCQGDPRGLSDPVVLIRRAAVEGLGSASTPDECLPRLLEALNDQDARVRAGAAAALARVHSGDVLDPLLAALADKDARARRRAALALAARGEGARTQLLEAFSSPDRHVRESAAMAAGLGAIRSLEEELLRLLSDGALSVRQTAADSLGSLGSRRLFDAMSSATGSVRSAAARGLGLIPGATGCLLSALADDDSSVRRSAAQSLAAQGDKGALGALSEALASDPSLLQASAMSMFSVDGAHAEAAARRAPRHCASLLLAHGSDGFRVLLELTPAAPSTETVAALLEATLRRDELDVERAERSLLAAGRSSDPLVRVAVVDALARLDRSVCEFLSDPSREVVARVSLALLGSGASDVEAELIEAVRNPRAPSAAFAALGSTGSARALEVLMEIAKQGGKTGNSASLGIHAFGSGAVAAVVRELNELLDLGRVEGVEAFVRSLAELEGEGVLDVLLRVASAGAAEARAAALRGLKKRRDPRTLEVLISALGSTHPAIAAAAADALGTEALGNDDLRVIRGLSDLVIGGEVEARQEAARAMAMLADRRAVPALAAALLDLDPEVRRDAAEALELLGIPVGVEVEAPIGR